MAAPNATTCAACGASGELHKHHLVPKVDGGTALPTVLLCTGCHGLVHGRPFSIKHSELTRRGLAAAKARGVKLGNPQLRAGDRFAARSAARVKQRQAAARAQDIAPYIAAAHKAGCTTLTQLAEALTARGIKTPGGRATWSAEQIRRILIRSAP